MLNTHKTSQEKPATGRGRLAQVAEAADGEALKLVDAEHNPIPFRGHNSHVPWLDVGDEVSLLDTPDGAMITGRSRRTGEHPPAAFSFQADALELTSDRPLRLRAGESCITLLPDGRIRIEGKVLDQVAQETVRLLGPVVEVN
jgi:hypothetical protein